MAKRYRVLPRDKEGRPVGLDYPPGRRAEPGDVVDDLPPKSIPWLLEQGLIEPVTDKKTVEKEG